MTDAINDLRKPTWTVIAVFDPDGQGSDFSYTVGLHERGMPELWMPGRPSLGDDPGFDWKFSQRDTCFILNELSWKWLAGELAIGDRWEETYDGGLVTARFQVDPPDDPEVLEAFQIEPGATVVPIRWSLHRQPRGENLPLTPEERERAFLRFGALTVPFPEVPVAPTETWALPDLIGLSPDQRWGPRTEVIKALAAYFWTCGPVEILDLVTDLGAIHELRRWDWPLATVEAAAWAAGRDEALDLLDDDIEDLLDSVLTPLSSGLLRVMGTDDEGELRYIRGACQMVLEVTLGVELVADVVDADVRLHSLGLLVANRFPSGVPAGLEWYASDAVNDAVDELLVEAGPARMFEVFRLAAEARDDRDRHRDHLAVRARLEAENQTTASNWSPAGGAADEVYLAELLAARDAAGWTGDLYLQEWASHVAAVLTHRLELSADEVEAFARPFAAVLPGLLERLNAPVTKA